MESPGKQNPVAAASVNKSRFYSTEDMASQQRIFKEPPQNIWKLQKIGTQGLEGCNEGSDYDFFTLVWEVRFSKKTDLSEQGVNKFMHIREMRTTR